VPTGNFSAGLEQWTPEGPLVRCARRQGARDQNLVREGRARVVVSHRARSAASSGVTPRMWSRRFPHDARQKALALEQRRCAGSPLGIRRRWLCRCSLVTALAWHGANYEGRPIESTSRATGTASPVRFPRFAGTQMKGARPGVGGPSASQSRQSARRPRRARSSSAKASRT
jgi:hypothetical protein